MMLGFEPHLLSPRLLQPSAFVSRRAAIVALPCSLVMLLRALNQTPSQRSLPVLHNIAIA